MNRFILAIAIFLTLKAFAPPPVPAYPPACHGVPSAVNAHALRLRWGESIFSPTTAGQKQFAAQLLKAHDNDAGQSLFLALSFPEAFGKNGFDHDVYLAGIKPYLESGYAPYDIPPVTISGSPEFARRFQDKHGVTPEQLLAELKRRHPTFDLKDLLAKLSQKPYDEVDTPGRMAALEAALLPGFEAADKRALATLLREMRLYTHELPRKFDRDRLWDTALGFPDHVPAGGGTFRDFGFQPGDRVILRSPIGEVKIKRLLGVGGEHSVYLVETKDGGEKVLKAGAVTDKVAEAKRIADLGHPVLAIEEVGPGYHFVERIDRTFHTEVMEVANGKAGATMAPAIAFYKKYLEHDFLVSDLKLDNLGITADGKLKISDWGRVTELGATATEAKKLELSVMLAKSFTMAHNRKKEVDGNPSTAWKQKLAVELEKFITELGLEAYSFRGEDLAVQRAAFHYPHTAVDVLRILKQQP